MPELPEVETIRRQMEKEVVGRTVRDAVVRFGGRLNLTPKKFVAAVKGAKIISVGRRAKLLLIGFSNGMTVVTHLKMTGRYLLVPAGAEPSKHVHVVFKLSGGKDLHFEDVRKFGYLRLYPTDELERQVFDKEAYGPEPLEKSFTAERFAMCVRGRAKKRIKPLLMEQMCIAGVGNIYADEALWRAKIRPQRRAGTLSDAELRALHDGVVGSLRESLRRRGTSADSYVDLYGEQGENVPHLSAYGREGKPCRRCGTPIKKISFAGRGTHFCPKCQR
jgi:formamidopyrimidine-DNA glycosylase